MIHVREGWRNQGAFDTYWEEMRRSGVPFRCELHVFLPDSSLIKEQFARSKEHWARANSALFGKVTMTLSKETFIGSDAFLIFFRDSDASRECSRMRVVRQLAATDSK